MSFVFCTAVRTARLFPSKRMPALPAAAQAAWFAGLTESACLLIAIWLEIKDECMGRNLAGGTAARSART
jgi:hypothetical protein